MATVSQEFYCNDCDGYILVPLNMALDNYAIEIVCPNCDRRHPRFIERGQIKESWCNKGKQTKDVILVTKAAYSKKPRHKASKKDMRDGAVITEPSRNKQIAKEIMKQSWFEKFAHRM